MAKRKKAQRRADQQTTTPKVVSLPEDRAEREALRRKGYVVRSIGRQQFMAPRGTELVREGRLAYGDMLDRTHPDIRGGVWMAGESVKTANGYVVVCHHPRLPDGCRVV